MKFEHIAINVKDPLKMAEWYKENIGLEIVKSMETAPYTHFLRDESGTMLMEIYCNPAGQVPDYKNMNPLILHLAFVSENPDSDKERLLLKGAEFVEEVIAPDNSKLIMMRDPWGVPVQLCKRTKTMFTLGSSQL